MTPPPFQFKFQDSFDGIGEKKKIADSFNGSYYKKNPKRM